MQDFPEYKPKVAKIYAQRFFNKTYYRKFLRSKKNCIMGAFENEKLVGIVVIKGDFGGVIFLELLLIDVHFRGRGIGMRLLKETEEWALSHQYHYMWLCTESNKNIEFYKRRGFVYVGMHRNAWYGENEHILEKVLQEKPFDLVFKKD